MRRGGEIGIIIQARLGSSRLPGKVLKEVCGKTLLEHQIARLKKVELAKKIIVATTQEAGIENLITIAENAGARVTQGDLDDVLLRYYEAAKAEGVDIIVRITSDCPLIDPPTVNKAIQMYMDDSRLDYLSNTLEYTYPRGLDTEVFHFHLLEEAVQEAKLPSHREHVTPFFYSQPERYRLENLRHPVDLSHYRWTVDTPEDLELITKIFEDLYPFHPEFVLDDILAAFQRHPEWYAINAHVKQKAE